MIKSDNNIYEKINLIKIIMYKICIKTEKMQKIK